MGKLAIFEPGRRWRLAAALLVGTLGTLGAASPAAALETHWVGNGGIAPCTHATLQDAIVTAQTNSDDDVIFVVGNVTLPGGLTVLPGGGHDLQITGGASACGSIEVTAAPTIVAPAGKRAITIAAGPGETVTLWNLVLTNQNGTYGGNGGAIYFTGDTANLVLVHVVVSDSNCLGDGGGLYLNSGTAELEGLTKFLRNAAANGGAIATHSASGAMLRLEGAVIEDNTAYLDGGGLYFPGGLVLFDGASAEFPVSIVGNLAGGKGGGAFLGANSESTFGFRSVVTQPIDIRLNQATLGGGLYVTSLDYAELGNVVIERNQANSGGGIYVGPNGKVYPTVPLGRTGGLPLLRDNAAVDGKAAFVDQGTFVLNGTITGHKPGAADSALITIENGVAVLHGMIIHHNTNARLADLGGESPEFAAVHWTVADNDFDALFLDEHTSPDPVLQIINGILAETEPFYAPPLPSLFPLFYCMLSRYGSLLQNLPAGTNTSQVYYGDPFFLNAGSGNYHLDSRSPAVDLCTVGDAYYLDPDGEARGFDAPNVPNPPGRIYDAGADEVTGLVLLIFADGFETGDTSRWSLTVP